MTTEPWQMVGTIASTAGVTTFAIGGAKGILAGYQTYASPHTCLAESEKRLERVRSRLQGLSPQRRQEIERASRGEFSNCLSLEYLEKQLEDLTDMHLRMGKRMEESTFTARHFPYSEFRTKLSRFEDLVKELLNDTLKTTVPCVDDIEFKPENPRRAMKRPSSSESAFDPVTSRLSLERPSSSKSSFNPENLRCATKGSSSSESLDDYKTARESFSDLGGIPLARIV